MDAFEPSIASTAYKHGMGESDILHAFNHPIFVEDLDEGFVLLIDPDTSGNLVELGVLDSSDGPVIIHAMSAQRKHLR